VGTGHRPGWPSHRVLPDSGALPDSARGVTGPFATSAET
jgi:hypothetical protein